MILGLLRSASRHKAAPGTAYSLLWEQLSCVACQGPIAGKPAPTGIAHGLRSCGRGGSNCLAQFLKAARPCGSGHAREHRRSRCQPPRRLLRGLARSHRYCAWLEVSAVGVGAGLPAIGAQSAPRGFSPCPKAAPAPRQSASPAETRSAPANAGYPPANGECHPSVPPHS